MTPIWLSRLPQHLREALAKYDWVIGADEVGYGAWAGPITVGAFVAPIWWEPDWIRDSKALSPNKRLAAEKRLPPFVGYSVAHVSAGEIDILGFKAALGKAFRKALTIMPPGLPVVVDGDAMPYVPEFKAKYLLRKADSKIPVVGAASIVAKNERDRLMALYGRTFPEYGFENHVGYGTEEHANALDKVGICYLHRRSVAPIKRRLHL